MTEKADWIKLTIKENLDGDFGGYEALTDEHITGDYREVTEWAIHILEELQTDLARKSETRAKEQNYAS